MPQELEQPQVEEESLFGTSVDPDQAGTIEPGPDDEPAGEPSDSAPTGEAAAEEPAGEAPSEAQDAKPETPKIPWDKARQRKDQQLADLRKARDADQRKIAEQERRLAALEQKLAAGPERDELAEVERKIAAHDKKEPDPDLEPDDYKTWAAKARTLERERGLAEAKKTAPATVATVPAATPEPLLPAEPDGNAPADRDYINQMLASADKDYGGHLRKDAVAILTKVFASRNYSNDNIPTRAVVEDLIHLSYMSAERAKGGPAAKPVPKPKPADSGGSRQALPTGEAATGAAPAQRDPFAYGQTIEEAKAEMVRQAKRGGGRQQ